MTIATYAQLQTAVADFLNREDLAAVVPTFIALAEAQIARDVRDWRMESRITFALNDGLEDLPVDWVETIRLGIDGEGEVVQVGPSDMMALRADIQRQGPPFYFAHVAGKIEVFPVPDADAVLVYRAKIPALSNDNTTNWLLTAAPDVYLYGSLIHSAPYLKDDPRIDVWAGLYASAVSAVNSASDRARHSGPLKLKVKAYG